MRNRINHCILDYDLEKEILSVRILKPLQGISLKVGSKAISLNEIKSECNKYWKYFDERIVCKEFDLSEKNFEDSYDDLITKGSILCQKLFDRVTRDHLWGLAGQSEILVLVTGLLNVPWEALYNPDGPGAGFLSDQCSIVTRWPEQTGNAERDLVTTPTLFGRSRVVCLDSILADDKQLMEGTSLAVTLREEGEHVHMPVSRRDLVRLVSDVRLVHWICEHAERGLRLSEEVFYSEDDAVAHKFPRGSTLVLTSCRSGGTPMSEIGIAAGICVASECTVIAPSSVVATRVGVQFVRRVNAILKADLGATEVRLVDLWSALKGTEPGVIGPREPKLSAERCYALWYGIYGSAETVVGGPLP